MSSNPIRLKYLFQKYLNNACSRQELDEFWLLMSELSENDLVMNELQQLWHTQEKKPSLEQDRLDHVFDRLQHKIEDYETGYAKKLFLPRRRLHLAVAASILLCIAFAWWQFNNYSGARTDPSAPLAKVNSYIRFITLPDGTRVTLNHDSKLDYPSTFDGSTRDVFLTGEAYFDVRHDSSKPFRVHTGTYITRVLGTAFNVKAYESDTQVEVTVARGKVQVQREDNNNSLGVLLPGDQLVINKESTAARISKANVVQVVKWKDTDLVFDDIRLEDAAAIIGRHFGVVLKFSNNDLLNCRFTGDFTDKSVEQLMDIICDLTRSTWKKEGESVILLEGEGCKNL